MRGRSYNRPLMHTCNSICNEDQDALLRIYPLQLLEQPEEQQRVRRAVREKHVIDPRPWLPVYLLQQTELLTRNEIRALVALPSHLGSGMCPSVHVPFIATHLPWHGFRSDFRRAFV